MRIMYFALTPSIIVPLPNPLAPGLHLGDAAAIPVMCLISPYLEARLPPATRKSFTELQPHSHTTMAFSPPFDVNSRRYSYYVGEGYSVGGIEFDECEAGGPSLNFDCFAPGVALWDTGRVGNGVGWISVSPLRCRNPEQAPCPVILYNFLCASTITSIAVMLNRF